MDGTVVSYPERMVVWWEDLRVGEDTLCRVLPLWENAVWFLFDLHGKLVLVIMVLEMVPINPS